MGDPYWNRQGGAVHPGAGQGLLKRPRSDYGRDMHQYLSPDDDRVGPRIINDTQTLESAYDRYLQSSQLSHNSGDVSNYGGGLRGVAGSTALPTRDRIGAGRTGMLGAEPAPSRRTEFSSHLPDEVARPRDTLPLPPDASSTLYIEGLPSDSSKREVAHIFRPFVGYKEVRLVPKESKHRGGDPLILCFVDFADPACAATALSALQGTCSSNIKFNSSLAVCEIGYLCNANTCS
ncbi:OLC1v1016670C1 [Oldenlandia corymbosa var. corymbosa]|uniref:OLC1v1016670C1 n=1 Tax=Oldenlandia corymbosa var. corymbosa TaxID=529605 RepID=A0AAV1E7P6_OLDCO|nr:OLC1v1016670C1 [Oldenlandia corymbosa var. corymbosa]